MKKNKKVIEVSNLRKFFRKTKAVDGASFSVREGEVFGFLGPNGAGKTTTIRCMMGFIKPNEGSIKIFNKEVSEFSTEIKKDVGYLSGNVELYKNWTGIEHIKYIESIRGKSEIANELISRLDFDPKKKFGNLSSGNKQKLGLIIALMHSPRLLIMDEPTVGLDPLLQNEIYEIIDELKEKGTTVFISSHNLFEVERICDRVGIIKEGKIVELSDINKLSGKKINIIKVSFSDKDKKEFSFKGVESVEKSAEGFVITTSGDVSPILKELSGYKIKDIEITKASLEDIFLKFYEKE